MTDDLRHDELNDRLKLIETMMAEGRQTTASWGWTFVLWGVAYYVATAWSTLGHNSYAWMITMIAAGIVTGIVGSRISRGRPRTSTGRALGGIWVAMGVSMFVVLVSLGFGGKYDTNIFVAIIGAMLAGAHGASAILLRWTAQFTCAVVWLAAAVASCFGTESQASIAFLAATFLGQIAFGIYAMVLDARRSRSAVHA